MISHATHECSHPVVTEHAGQARAKPVVNQVETVVRIASSRQDLHAAFSLVYHAYIRGGLALPNRSGMRITPYHLLPSTEVFIALQNGKVVSTLTLVVDGELGLPMETVYGCEVERHRRQHTQPGKIAEVSCLADRKEEVQCNLSVVVQIMSLMAQRARRLGVAELLIAVHPKHVPFYERVTGFEQIGERKSYDLVCEKPAVALALDLENVHINNPRAHKKFFGKPFPHEKLQDQPIADGVRSELEMIFKKNELVEKHDVQQQAASYSLPLETKAIA